MTRTIHVAAALHTACKVRATREGLSLQAFAEQALRARLRQRPRRPRRAKGGTP